MNSNQVFFNVSNCVNNQMTFSEIASQCAEMKPNKIRQLIVLLQIILDEDPETIDSTLREKDTLSGLLNSFSRDIRGMIENGLPAQKVPTAAQGWWECLDLSGCTLIETNQPTAN